MRAASQSGAGSAVQRRSARQGEMGHHRQSENCAPEDADRQLAPVGYTATFEYFLCAACLETPNIAPISDHDRSARRAERMASTNAASTSPRRSASSAIARSDRVSATIRSSGSTASAHASRAFVRAARVVLISSTIPSGTWLSPALRGSRQRPHRPRPHRPPTVRQPSTVR